MTEFIVSYTSMVIEADTADDAIARAEDGGGGNWEAVPYDRDHDDTAVDWKAEARRLADIIKAAYSNQGWDIGTVKNILLPGLEGYEHLTPQPEILTFDAQKWDLGFAEGSSEDSWWIDLDLCDQVDESTARVRARLSMTDVEAIELSDNLMERVREGRKDWS